MAKKKLKKVTKRKTKKLPELVLPPAVNIAECFRCDGTGELCNICGESVAVCSCGRSFDDMDVQPCDDCEGSGQ